MSMRRVRAIYLKEMREYRRNKQIIATMSFSPIGFIIFPVIFLFSVNASDVSILYDYPVQVFSLAVAAVLPSIIGGYSIVGEREQGTLEPLLGTPIRTEELILGKALTIVVAAGAWSYLIFGVLDAAVWLFRPAAVSSVELRPSILLTQLISTPLLVILSTWISMLISARARDSRVAGQLALVVSLPVIAAVILIGVDVIQFTAPVVIVLGAALVVLDVAGWPLVSKTFNRERLVLGTR
jgi:ABC-type transport system involved in multi-copper enzyme maturation permease subunit